MRFKDFYLLVEATDIDWGFMGDLLPYLGGGLGERLNYGTAPNFGSSAMLYVPVKRGDSPLASVIASARRSLEKQGIDCVPDPSAFNGWRCGPSSSPHRARILGTGESHVTVAYGTELAAFFAERNGGVQPDQQGRLRILSEARLRDGTPLFDGKGRGVGMPIQTMSPPQLTYGVAKAFKGNPIVCMLTVSCPMTAEVRNALGLAPRPNNYTHHITIGYTYGKLGRGFLSTNVKAPGDYTGNIAARHHASYLQGAQVT